MSEHEKIERLLNLFEVQVDAFAICEIAKNAGLKCDPIDDVVVHFVLKGSGQIQFENQTRVLCPESVVIVPSRTSKILAGDGPVETICDAKHQCPLEDQLIHFKAGNSNPDLVLGCAAVTASIAGAIDVFEHLWEPMVENAVGPAIAPLRQTIEQELATPGVGSRAVLGAMMKQILIGVFRRQLEGETYRSWLWPAMLHPQLGKAALAMMSRPQDPHTIDSLALIAGMSRSRFAKHFSQEFGRSPIDFLQAVRLRLGQRLLAGSSLPVKSVAAAVGYSSRSHFTRSFQARFGSDPSGFRRISNKVTS